LYSVLLLGGMLIVVKGQRSSGLAHAAAAGLVFGVAALTRETALSIAAMAAVWWCATATGRARSRALGKGTILCVVAAACGAPWTLRNYLLFGRLVPIATVGWFAAAEGNSLESPDWMVAWGPRRATFKFKYLATHGELERMDFARRQALEAIAEEQPAW